MKAIPLVDLAAHHALISGEIRDALSGVMESCRFIMGANVAAFESEFADLCGATDAIACGNGTDALELALTGAHVRPGSEVITVANSFAATAEAIVRCGARPRFVDIEPDSHLISVKEVERAISTRTGAILPVHLFGACADMAALSSLAAEHSIPLVEDAAQAHAAELPDGRRAGSAGLAGCFSFYPGKNLGALGDAGAVVTSDPEIAQYVRRARDHGRAGKYEHDIIGRNSRMDELQGAVLRKKLAHLRSWTARRRQLARRYFEPLEANGVRCVKSKHPEDAVYHLFVIQVDDRIKVQSALKAHNIASGIHYPIPLHRQSAFTPYLEPPVSLPVTERAAETVLSLPMYPELEEADVDRIVEVVLDAVGTRTGGQ